MPKSPEEMAASMVANMKDKTGKTLEQWLAVAKKTKLAKHGEIVKSLKTDHGLTHGYANLVAHKLLKSDAGSQAAVGTDLVAAQYAGVKADLRPILRQPPPQQAVRADPTVDQDARRPRAQPEGRGGEGPAGSIGQLQLDGVAPRAPREGGRRRQGREGLAEEGVRRRVSPTPLAARVS